jgi:hypothetical protein
MKKLSIASTILVLSTGILGAQGKHGGGGPPMHTTPSQQSNAPSSSDRDLGKARAEDVGKGEKKGLQKNTSRQKSKRVVKHSGNK